MSLEDFQILDNEPIDKIIDKRFFFEIYHQQGAQSIDPNQNIEFTFGEIDNYHQKGNGYLEFGITVRRNDNTNFHYDDPIRLLNYGFAYCFIKRLL